MNSAAAMRLSLSQLQMSGHDTGTRARWQAAAPDPFVAPFFNSLLERTPRPQPDAPLTYRKDEYPDES
jgi:hypothetical protein